MREQLLKQQREEIDKLQQTSTAEREQFKQRMVKEHKKELQTLKDTLSVEQEKVSYSKSIVLRIISHVPAIFPWQARRELECAQAASLHSTITAEKNKVSSRRNFTSVLSYVVQRLCWRIYFHHVLASSSCRR